MSDLVSSASVGVGRSCYRHADAAGSQTCTRCRRSICEGCVSVGGAWAGAAAGSGEICVGCAAAGRRRGAAVVVTSVVAAAVVVIAAIAFVATRPAAIEYGEHRFEIERLAARVENTACDGKSTLELADLLNKERDFPRVIRVVEGFDEKCQPVPRMYWESYGARIQLQDFAGATADASKLIADDGDDGDFWWWRAKARRKAGDFVGAEADLRRSAELSGKSAYWAVIDLADLLEEQGRACEGVPLLTQVVRNNEEKAKKARLDGRIARLIREVPCADASAALPPGDQEVAALCQTLPSRLLVDDQGIHKDVSTSAFELSLSNTWQARTRGVATGKPLSCRADLRENDISNFHELKGSGMKSWTGRLICDGLPSVSATSLNIGPLHAEEALALKLIDVGVRRWCHPG